MSVAGNTVAALISRSETDRDEYGNQVFAEVFTVLPGIYWPDSSTEATVGQDQVQWRETLCLPTGTDVAAVDAVIPRVVTDGSGRAVLDDDGHPQGAKFEVNGQPQAWPPTPDGWQADFSVVLHIGKELG